MFSKDQKKKKNPSDNGQRCWDMRVGGIDSVCCHRQKGVLKGTFFTANVWQWKDVWLFHGWRGSTGSSLDSPPTTGQLPESEVIGCRCHYWTWPLGKKANSPKKTYGPAFGSSQTQKAPVTFPLFPFTFCIFEISSFSSYTRSGTNNVPFFYYKIFYYRIISV